MVTLDTTSGIQLEYLAEGAANIVYKILPLPPSPSIAAETDFENYEHPPSEIAPPLMDPGLEGKLVRLRKATPSGVTVAESYRYYENDISPLFPQKEDLVEHVLFSPTRTLLESLNNQLKAMEINATRPKKRHSLYLAERESHGLLVTDMSCSINASATYRCFEFKPKWLLQSPSAPPDAVRCRTCALRHLRRSQDHGNPTAGAGSRFCPLGLLSKEKEVVEKTVANIFERAPGVTSMKTENEVLRKHLLNYVYQSPLLEHLSELQRTCDPFSIVNTLDSTSTRALSIAMTLRDCTLFLKIPIHEGEIEARLGDFDFKSPDGGKGEYWRKLERQLIDEGWYTAREKTQVEMDILCVLSTSP